MFAAKKIFPAAVMVCCFFSASAQKRKSIHHTGKPVQARESAKKTAGTKKMAATSLQYFITRTDSTSYGYAIYADSRLFIQQNTIPAISGGKGFPDMDSAARTAELVIQKIKSGQMPPSVTTEELKQLNIMQ
jgi:Domain of unknown function (DUF4907)